MLALSLLLLGVWISFKCWKYSEIDILCIVKWKMEFTQFVYSRFRFRQWILFGRLRFVQMVSYLHIHSGDWNRLDKIYISSHEYIEKHSLPSLKKLLNWEEEENEEFAKIYSFMKLLFSLTLYSIFPNIRINICNDLQSAS